VDISMPKQSSWRFLAHGDACRCSIPCGGRKYALTGLLRLGLKRGEHMDNVTLIRVVAGILAAFVFVILILRMKKKAPR